MYRWTLHWQAVDLRAADGRKIISFEACLIQSYSMLQDSWLISRFTSLVVRIIPSPTYDTRSLKEWSKSTTLHFRSSAGFSIFSLSLIHTLVLIIPHPLLLSYIILPYATFSLTRKTPGSNRLGRRKYCCLFLPYTFLMISCPH